MASTMCCTPVSSRARRATSVRLRKMATAPTSLPSRRTGIRSEMTRMRRLVCTLTPYSALPVRSTRAMLDWGRTSSSRRPREAALSSDKSSAAARLM